MRNIRFWIWQTARNDSQAAMVCRHDASPKNKKKERKRCYFRSPCVQSWKPCTRWNDASGGMEGSSVESRVKKPKKQKEEKDREWVSGWWGGEKAKTHRHTAGVSLHGCVHRASGCTEIFQRPSPIIRRHDGKKNWFAPSSPSSESDRWVHLTETCCAVSSECKTRGHVYGIFREKNQLHLSPLYCKYISFLSVTRYISNKAGAKNNLFLLSYFSFCSCFAPLFPFLSSSPSILVPSTCDESEGEEEETRGETSGGNRQWTKSAN